MKKCFILAITFIVLVGPGCASWKQIEQPYQTTGVEELGKIRVTLRESTGTSKVWESARIEYGMLYGIQDDEPISRPQADVLQIERFEFSDSGFFVATTGSIVLAALVIGMFNFNSISGEIQ